MKWSEYYSKFYDWAESTQVNRISSLVNFSSTEELLEIAAELDEKGASKLIQKALSQGVCFSAEEVSLLSEFTNKDTVACLCSSCKEAFTFAQIQYIEEHSMMYADEVQKLVAHKYDFANLTWEDFYANFYDLPDDKKLLGAMMMHDFSAKDEVVEIIFQLAEYQNAEQFIFRVLDNELPPFFGPKPMLVNPT